MQSLRPSEYTSEVRGAEFPFACGGLQDLPDYRLNGEGLPWHTGAMGSLLYKAMGNLDSNGEF